LSHEPKLGGNAPLGAEYKTNDSSVSCGRVDPAAAAAVFRIWHTVETITEAEYFR
jgi:hypothetical protein